ncbi:7-ethoxycoumarin O-deethylase-like protein [Tanacetum coccineum]
MALIIYTHTRLTNVPISSRSTQEMFSIVLALLICYKLMQAIFTLLSLGKPKNLPPGLTPLPIIGNLHQLGEKPHRSLVELAKIRGPIMFLKLGRINTLVISSAAAAKLVLQKQDLAFSNRFVSDVVYAHNHFQESVVWLPIGAKWRSLRKIFNSNIFSGKRLDNGISKQLRSQKDSGKEFKEVVWNIMELVGKPNLVDFFPVLKRIDPQGIRRRMTENCGKVLEIFEGLINERLEMRKNKNGVQGEHDDILEILLNDSQQKHEELNLSLIKSLCLDLFVAGTDTTASTLEWAMAEVLANQHIMAQAKDEFSQVIGKGKILDENDVLRLPYLQNIVKETLRIHAPVPLLLPRKLQSQIEINGYMILLECDSWIRHIRLEVCEPIGGTHDKTFRARLLLHEMHYM